MGCGPSRPEDDRDARQVSNAIDRRLEEDYRRVKRECKILLLGSGESGKSTIVKQMKIIHQNGYTQDELSLYRTIVFRNLLDSAKAITDAIEIAPDLTASEPEACLAVSQYQFEGRNASDVLPNEMFEAIRKVAHQAVTADVLGRRSEFYIMDSAEYFFGNIDRIHESDYLPNEMDVLRARTKTTGIYETRFDMGSLSVHMFDVGGQRSERKKWIHCFEAVTSIIFCVALSEYDQVLLEESSQNRMQESLQLFESILNSRWFLRTSVILFLNKIDIFKNKIEKVPLENYFPEYTAGPDVNKAAKYILWLFSQVNRSKLTIYPHLTQATDTSNIRLVFAAVKETVLQNALRESGIL